MWLLVDDTKGNKCDCMVAVLDRRADVDRLAGEGFDVLGHPVLVIPDSEDVC